MRSTMHSGLAAIFLFVGAATAQSLPTDHQPGFEECTVGVASGRATRDGRPLLWKNRDASAVNNEVVYFDDGRYAFVGIVNAGQTKSVWGGVNERGFCIMNSLSTDLPGGSPTGLGNGALMRVALETCADLDDFAKLLVKTDKGGRRTKANFGVIDAQGGAAIFETSHTAHRLYDATDPETAPEGYIVRANFAMTGGGDGGRQRYERAGVLCRTAVDTERLDYQYLLRDFCRDLDGAEKMGEQLRLQNSINRRSTVSAMVFHGVNEEENPALTTFWAILGEPILSVAVPCWVRAKGTAPELDGKERSPLCDLAIEIKKQSYVMAESGPLRLEPKGVAVTMPVTLAAEDRIFDHTEKAMNDWRRKLPAPRTVKEFHDEMARSALAGLRKAQKALIQAGTTVRR